MGSTAAVGFSQLIREQAEAEDMWKENKVLVLDMKKSRENWSSHVKNRQFGGGSFEHFNENSQEDPYNSCGLSCISTESSGSDGDEDDCGTPKAEEHKILQYSMFGPPPPPPSKPRHVRKSNSGVPEGGYFNDPELESFLSPHKSHQT